MSEFWRDHMWLVITLVETLSLEIIVNFLLGMPPVVSTLTH